MSVSQDNYSNYQNSFAVVSPGDAECLIQQAPHREAPEANDDQVPVRACHRYLSARKRQLKYLEALTEGLLICSKDQMCASPCRAKAPEAARRLVRVENAEYMLALPLNRLKGD